MIINIIALAINENALELFQHFASPGFYEKEEAENNELRSVNQKPTFMSSFTRISCVIWNQSTDDDSLVTDAGVVVAKPNHEPPQLSGLRVH